MHAAWGETDKAVHQAAKDVALVTEDGSRMLAHSAVLEIDSPLLHAALAEAAKQR